MTKEYLICLLGFIETFLKRHTVARAEQPLRQSENRGDTGHGWGWGSVWACSDPAVPQGVWK